MLNFIYDKQLVFEDSQEFLNQKLEEERKKKLEEARKRKEDDTRRQAMEEAKRKAEEEARRQADEEAKKKDAEKKRQDDEKKRKEEEEKKKKLDDEAKKKQQEERKEDEKVIEFREEQEYEATKHTVAYTGEALAPKAWKMSEWKKDPNFNVKKSLFENFNTLDGDDLKAMFETDMKNCSLDKYHANPTEVKKRDGVNWNKKYERNSIYSQVGIETLGLGGECP